MVEAGQAPVMREDTARLDDDAAGGACLLTDRGRSVGRTKRKGKAAGAGVSAGLPASIPGLDT